MTIPDPPPASEARWEPDHVDDLCLQGPRNDGKVVKGKVEAPSEAAVVARLRTMSISPIEVSASTPGTGLQMELNLGFLDKGVGLKDLAIMSRQMATMVGAGLSLLRTLTILAEQTENKKLASPHAVRTLVESGSALSEAMSRQGRVFPPLMIHLVRAGETGGFLDQSLESIASTFEKDVKLRPDHQVGA
jgi:type IV pilus assembly protein PilC